MPQNSYDIIAVGSGFATSFFLHAYLRYAPPTARVLVLERGQKNTPAWYFENIDSAHKAALNQIVNLTPEKKWRYLLKFGGGSNCWWACTPRMLPEDFELHKRYGQGSDWPIGYNDLEEYYSQAEEIMAVAGPSDDSPFPRSRPYPQPPHRISDADAMFKGQFPDQFFAMPTARARQPVAGQRTSCCANTTCNRCPIDAKFTVQNGMRHVFSDSRVEVLTGAEVYELELADDIVRGVRYRFNNEDFLASADFVALGANGIFNPYIMLNSGIDGEQLGKGLSEQTSLKVTFYLDGVDNFQGSTSLTGHGYMLYGGASRADRAASLMETSNIPVLRNERGRWREVLVSKFIFEDMRQTENSVTSSADTDRPVVTHKGVSQYTQNAVDKLADEIDGLVGDLPITDFEIAKELKTTEAHIIGTTVMGMDALNSVVDEKLLHHRYRNLAVLGSGTFPTMSPANPTLTLSALSLWSATQLWGIAAP